ncbi:caspase family protein [Pyxidicoccus xibeiensis]|uniref:caspase family protein n=1 Tax=Pyxidicoccus xibeiensis TaxID=2906759 RepID=UPI0020A6DE03|nr:caspase family protein [Pyxidicoccus xibeiensis]MCP3137462.1 caspase family protein [Pyxidicoccus xibeiensis]
MMLLTLLTAALLSQSPGTQPGAEPLPRRYALLVGANQGLTADTPLRFADSDARRVFTLFRDAGGLGTQDAQLVLDADAGRVRAALEVLRARMAREAGPADQLLVYVSSHADGDSLHLSGSQLPVKELVRFMEEAPVGVAVMFIDSCRSGAATRVKGLQPVEERLVQWSAPAIQGRVIVTSSSADELSQEADDLQGSYFTHHLLAGLRGAGDVTRDGRVTLQEAYTYAYGRTVESTLLTRAGTQHPAFLFDLKGQGELVLTAPVSASSRLVITVPEPGEWVVATEEGGMVLGVFSKGTGPVMLAVPPGGYRLRVRRDTSWLETRITVPERGVATVDGPLLRQGTLVARREKGEAPPDWRGGVSLGGSVATRTARGLGAALGVQGLVVLRTPVVPGVVDALSVTAARRSSDSDALASFRQTEWELRLGLGHHFKGKEGTIVFGPEVGGLLVLQSEDGKSWSGFAPYGGVGLSAWLSLEVVSVVVTGAAGFAAFPDASGTRFAPRLGASAGLGWIF